MRVLFFFFLWLGVISLSYTQTPDSLEQDTGRNVTVPSPAEPIPEPDPQDTAIVPKEQSALQDTVTEQIDTSSQDFPADTELPAETNPEPSPARVDTGYPPPPVYNGPPLPDTIPAETIRAYVDTIGVQKIAPVSPVGGEISEGTARKFSSMDHNSWLFYTLLGLLVFLGLIRVFFPRDIEQIFIGFGNYNIANQLYREEETSSRISFFLLTIAFFIVMGIFLMQIAHFFGVELEVKNFQLAGLGFASVAILYFFRMTLYFFMALIFTFGDTIRLFRFHTEVIYRVLGIVLLPLLILITFLPEQYASFVFYLTLFAVALFIVFRYWRGLRIAGEFLRFYKFHFILYLCVLEIAPVIIIMGIAKAYIL